MVDIMFCGRNGFTERRGGNNQSWEGGEGMRRYFSRMRRNEVQ